MIAQSPAALASVQHDMTVLLTVAGPPEGELPCSADIAYNLAIEENGSSVMVTIAEAVGGVPVERVVFETTLESGAVIPVSFTAHAATEGLHEIILYVNGQEQRRQEASFLPRGGA